MASEADLYKSDLSAVGDPELFATVEVFTHVAQAATDRTQESYLLDFKERWSDPALQTVATFANTFEGLLQVGVSEKDGRADQLIGIASQRQELKTSIASAIASNISPTPPHEIREITFPQEGGSTSASYVSAREIASICLPKRARTLYMSAMKMRVAY